MAARRRVEGGLPLCCLLLHRRAGGVCCSRLPHWRQERHDKKFPPAALVVQPTARQDGEGASSTATQFTALPSSRASAWCRAGVRGPHTHSPPNPLASDQASCLLLCVSKRNDASALVTRPASPAHLGEWQASCTRAVPGSSAPHAPTRATASWARRPVTHSELSPRSWGAPFCLQAALPAARAGPAPQALLVRLKSPPAPAAFSAQPKAQAQALAAVPPGTALGRQLTEDGIFRVEVTDGRPLAAAAAQLRAWPSACRGGWHGVAAGTARSSRLESAGGRARPAGPGRRGSGSGLYV